MQFHKMPLQDCLLIIPEVFKEHRGVFLERYHRRGFVEATGFEIEFVQDNQSVSNSGVFTVPAFSDGRICPGQTGPGNSPGSTGCDGRFKAGITYLSKNLRRGRSHPLRKRNEINPF